MMQRLVRFSLATFNKPTILQNLKSYKNSAAQSHLHDYLRDEKQLKKIKSQKIDMQFITKESAGVLMFREYAFQEKTEQTLVPHLNCSLQPSGAWTAEQIMKEIEDVENVTKTQEQNKEILQECESDIEKAIRQYYENLGKKNYQFNLTEEINKINQMTDEQFQNFSKVLAKNKITNENTKI